MNWCIAIAHACTIAIVNACTIATEHACTIAIIHACTINISYMHISEKTRMVGYFSQGSLPQAKLPLYIIPEIPP